MNHHLSSPQHDGQNLLSEGVQETPIPMSTLPGVYNFSEELASFQPSTHALFLARSADGPLTIAFPVHDHIAVTGPTCSGKSTILRLLLGQFLALDVACYLCDEYYVPVNQMNGLDWTPLEMRLARPPLRTSKAIADFLQWLSTDELETRKERAYLGQFVGQPIVVMIDNLTELISAEPEIASSLSTLLRQSLKYGIVLVLSSQDLHPTSVRLSKETLEHISTGYFCGGDSRTARVVLDLRAGDQRDERGLGAGVVYVRTRGLLPTRGRIPWPDNTSVGTLCAMSTLPLHELEREQTTSQIQQALLSSQQTVMSEATYVAEIMRTYAGPDRVQEKLTLAALGLAGETGEIVDAVKKYLFQGHGLVEDALEDELGDVLWYFMLLSSTLGFSLEQIMRRNVAKLQKRYPNGFESHRSVNRDLHEERGGTQ